MNIRSYLHLYNKLKKNTTISWVCVILYVIVCTCLENWFAMQGPVAVILISWNVIFIWETGYWTRAIKRFALFDLLKSLYSDTNILSKYIPVNNRKTENRNDPDLVQAFLKKWWVESDFKAPNLPLSLRLETFFVL
jgi:hypothetical protein